MQKFKTLLSLFFTYFKIGLFTFGGGYAMIALIEENVVNKKQWITKDELADIVTIAEYKNKLADKVANNARI